MRIEPPSKQTIAIVSVVAAMWAYLANVSVPLRRDRAELDRGLSVAQSDVAIATAELKVLKNRKARAEKEAASFQWANHLLEALPRSYMVEYPLKFHRSLDAEGLEAAEVRLEKTFPLPDLPEFSIARWQLRVPKGRVLPFGKSLAKLENDFPLGSLKDLSIRRSSPDGSSEIVFDFETVVRP